MPLRELADFTSHGKRPVVCQRCHESFEEGTKLYYMQDRNLENPGKRLCAGCRQHYVRKTEAIQQGSSAHTVKQVTPETYTTNTSEQVNIRKAVAAAQKKGHNHPLRVGPSIGATSTHQTSSRTPWPKRLTTRPTEVHPTSQLQRTSGGGLRPIVLPKFVSNPEILEETGYQKAHLLYDEMRQFFARKAMVEHQSEVVIIKVTMMSLKPGYRNPQVVSNMSETVSNIPLHIGVKDLKAVAYFTLLPLFSKWSKEFPLSVNDLQLCFKDWVELIPLGPKDEDVNAISSKFFVPKGKSKALQFQPNKVLDLYLELSNDLYREILDHLDDIENNALNATVQQPKMSISYIMESDKNPEYDTLPKSQPLTTNYDQATFMHPIEGTARLISRKRERSGSDNAKDVPPLVRPRIQASLAKRNTRRQTTQAIEKSADNPPSSPTADDVRCALQAQTAPSKKKVKSILNTKAIRCVVYPTSDITFHSLIKHSRTFDATKESAGPKMATLMFDPREKPIYGAFKQALFGRLDEAVLGKSTSVVIKQCWYTTNVVGNRAVHDNHTQITKLTGEINCLRWASALMRLVYDFIDSFTKEHGLPPFAIPSMQFVKSGLAIAEDTHDTFLLEEVINDAISGNFIKYIGNGSVEPFDFLEGDDIERGNFLSFCQHVQFIKTKQFAFVGDFQGGQHLLTDPQLITSSETGQIFSEGNLTSTHSTFKLEHACNYFCKFFQLQAFSGNLDDNEIEDGELVGN